MEKPTKLGILNLMNKSDFLFDIWSIKENGIDNWQQNKNYWPINENEFYSLGDSIYELYGSLINKSDHYTSILFSAIIKINVQYLMFIHDIIFNERLKGINVIYKNNDQFNSVHMDIAPNRIFDNYKNKYDIKYPTLKQKLKNELYLYKCRLDYSLHNYSIVGNVIPSKNNGIISSSKPSSDFLKFANNNKYGFNFLNFLDILPDIKLDAVFKSKIIIAEKEIDYLLKKLGEIAKAYGAELNDWHLAYISQLTKVYLKSADYCIQNSFNKLKKTGGEYLAIHGSGNLFNRCITLGAELANYKTIGGTHGNNPGYHTNGSSYMNEFSYSTHLLVPTRGSKKLYENQQKKNFIKNTKNQKIISVDTNHYVKLTELNQLHKIPRKLSSIIFVEYPLSPQRHGLRIGFWYYHLQIALKVGLILKTHGIRSLMKRHPDRLAESEFVYDNYFDEVLIESFEEVYNKADAIFFPNLATSTFGFSLTTNKPIFIFEDLLDYVDRDVHSLIKKRCVVIPSSFTKNGGLEFDEDFLINSLKKPVNKPNNELLHEFFYP